MSVLLVNLVVQEFGQSNMSYINLLAKSPFLKDLSKFSDGTIVSNTARRMRDEIRSHGVGCPMLITELVDFGYNYPGAVYSDQYVTPNFAVSEFFPGIHMEHGWFMYGTSHLAPTASVFDVSLWIRPHVTEGPVFPILDGRCLHKNIPSRLQLESLNDCEKLFATNETMADSARHFTGVIMPFVATKWKDLYKMYVESESRDCEGPECMLCGYQSTALHSHHQASCNSGFCTGVSCSNCITRNGCENNKCPFCRQLIQHTLPYSI